MLSKFIEDCNRLLPDGTAESARCMGLCVHSTCRSTMSAREQSANDSEKQWPPNSPNLNHPCRYHVWGRCTKFFESFTRSPIQFLN